ncbi:hypothetical protein KSP39_PZI009349 [Platanthera zijinensis]|uniref:Uncharacterized protein n=1 Tax=Platanthera zijinensis TaxID=2320716 RepID=A0AAP0BNH1_9ASPA
MQMYLGFVCFRWRRRGGRRRLGGRKRRREAADPKGSVFAVFLGAASPDAANAAVRHLVTRRAAAFAANGGSKRRAKQGLNLGFVGHVDGGSRHQAESCRTQRTRLQSACRGGHFSREFSPSKQTTHKATPAELGGLRSSPRTTARYPRTEPTMDMVQNQPSPHHWPQGSVRTYWRTLVPVRQARQTPASLRSNRRTLQLQLAALQELDQGICHAGLLSSSPVRILPDSADREAIRSVTIWAHPAE